MDTNLKLKDKLWWSYLPHDLKELLNESFLLAEKSANWEMKFHDYSFIVFPAAKAYEGFLKNLFLDMGFISEGDYHGKRFRIGKALNPHLESKYRKESVYDSLAKFCGGEEMPEKLWKTWKMSRNLLFHWFPDEANAIDHPTAVKRVDMIVQAMDRVYQVCKLEK